MSAPVGNKNRCKLTIVTEATTKSDICLPLTAVLPYDTHFYPPAVKGASQEKRPESRRSGQPMLPVNFVPLAEPVRHSQVTPT